MSFIPLDRLKYIFRKLVFGIFSVIQLFVSIGSWWNSCFSVLFCFFLFCLFIYLFILFFFGGGAETKSAHFFRLKTLFSKPLHTIRVSNSNLKWTWIVFVISTRVLNYLRLPLDIYNKNHIANFFFLSGLSFTNIHKSQDCWGSGRAFLYLLTTKLSNGCTKFPWTFGSLLE